MCKAIFDNWAHSQQQDTEGMGRNAIDELIINRPGERELTLSGRATIHPVSLDETHEDDLGSQGGND